MAKRKRIDTIAPMAPSPGARRKWAAESMAHTIIETAPGRKKELDAITAAVMKAGEKAEKTARRGKP